MFIKKRFKDTDIFKQEDKVVFRKSSPPHIPLTEVPLCVSPTFKCVHTLVSQMWSCVTCRCAVCCVRASAYNSVDVF